MSHQPERQEKNCLNCHAELHGRYCHVCGQENIPPKHSVVGFVRHFIYDVLHFDGKFYLTLKKLLFQPGFIPKQYIVGKRISWLDPVRMYLFTSALFFVIFFAVRDPSTEIITITDPERPMTKMERLEYASSLYNSNSRNSDPALDKQLSYLLDTAYNIALSKQPMALTDSVFKIKMFDSSYFMKAERIKNELLVTSNNNWLEKTLNKKLTQTKAKFGDDRQAMILEFSKVFMHRFPYILFVSLPFFALFLKLLYLRRKHFFYSDHAIFTLYHYIFALIILLFYLFFSLMYNWLHWGIFRVFAVLFILSIGVYLLIGMKRFYGQGWVKTIFKFLILGLAAIIMMVVIMLLFLLLSFIQL